MTVEVRFAKEFAAHLTLKWIKAEPDFADWELVRNSRLSVMPVSEKQWRRVEQLIGE